MKLTKYLSIFILLFSIGANLVWFREELTIRSDPNDNIFQFALVNRTNWVWENYGCPFSLKCLPNLVDHWVPNWAEGFSLPFYYSHAPQIAIVASYQFFRLFLPINLFRYYHLIIYLLMCLLPLSVFLGVRILGLSWVTAALGALFTMHLSTDGLYGIDVVSWLWRGYGLASQLFSIIFAPLALAYIYRYLSSAPNSGNLKRFPELIRREYFLPALIFSVLAVAGHLGIGFIVLFSLAPFLFIDFKISNITARAKSLFSLLLGVFAILSYWIIPFYLGSSYHMISFWDPPWKFNSYGFYEVIKQLQNGLIFDFGRGLPVLTILSIIGFLTLFTNKKYFAFSLLFPFWFLLYFGRTTWGGLLDIIPGLKDFHLHRFIVGLHLIALFLVPVGIETILILLNKSMNKLVLVLRVVMEALTNKSKIKDQRSKIQNGKLIFAFLAIITIVLIYNYTIRQTLDYNFYNNKWVKEADSDYNSHAKDLGSLLNYLSTLPVNRMYVGRGGNWGKDFKFGSTYMYMFVSVNGYETMGFLPETWSPNSENEQLINEQNLRDYDLYNLRYIIAPKNAPVPLNRFKYLTNFGPYYVYEAPTTGYFDVVKPNIFLQTEKTHFMNFVHLWSAGNFPDYKSYPLLSVENKNPPLGINKVIRTIDTTNYSVGNLTYNLFATSPFAQPEATPSGKILSQQVNRQAYQAKVSVPLDCHNCFTLFKMTYHPNWKAEIDGKGVSEIYTAFPFFSAIPVPPGEHTVSFSYEPSRLKIALILIELAGLVFLLYKYKKSKIRQK